MAKVMLLSVFACAAAETRNATQAGPYGVDYKAFFFVPGMDATDQTISVWAPKSDGGQRFPFISYAHGDFGGATSLLAAYGGLLANLASFGYVVAAPHACNTGCSDLATRLFDPVGFKNYYLEQLRAIDWAKSEAALGNSPFININFDLGVGVAGHSMGGQATLYSSSAFGTGHDIRAAVMHHAYTHSYPTPSVPFLAMTGSADTVAPYAMTKDFYEVQGAHPTKAYVNKLNSDHFEPNAALPFSYNMNLAKYTAAWFKVHLDKTPQADNLDYDDLIFGSGINSLCHGGNGLMLKCETNRGFSDVVL